MPENTTTVPKELSDLLDSQQLQNNAIIMGTNMGINGLVNISKSIRSYNMTSVIDNANSSQDILLFFLGNPNLSATSDINLEVRGNTSNMIRTGGKISSFDSQAIRNVITTRSPKNFFFDYRNVQVKDDMNATIYLDKLMSDAKILDINVVMYIRNLKLGGQLIAGLRTSAPNVQPTIAQPTIVQPADSMYALDKPGNIYRCDAPCTGAWKQIPGQLSTLVADKTSIYGTNSNNDIYTCKKPCTGAWKQLSGKLNSIVSDNESIYGTNNEGKSFKCKIPCGEGGNNFIEIPSSQRLTIITGNEHFSNEHFTTGISTFDNNQYMLIIVVLIIGIAIYYLYVRKN